MIRRRTVTALAGLLLLPLAVARPAPAADPDAGLEDFPAPVDPQSWVLPDWMTWDDYRPIPGVNWNDPARQPAKKVRAALLLGDFSDRDFIVTMPEGSDVFGIDGVHNPIGVGSIPREQVADWYAKFLITEPNALNRGHTVNEYWLEDSYGVVGIDADGFGPYRMEGKEHEYGGLSSSACPAGDSCSKNFDNELLTASLADVTTGIVTNGGRDYDFRYLLHAGYDESGTWQEFGEMMFPTRDDVSEEFGNPDPSKPNWTGTRYVPWTSWASAEGIWSHAIPGVMSTQGESDGAATYAHELSHIFGVLDNYNNPYGNPLIRSYSGPWDMLSRGTFNGPGGTHNRWQIPATQGATMGSHHMLRNKLRLGFMKPSEVLFLERGALARTGPLVVDLWPRAVPLAPTTSRVGLHGIQVAMDRDNSSCSSSSYDCDRGGYHNYTVEVVDRLGYDSFTPDHGVLIAKTKNADTAPFIWVIDAHPSDIDDASPPPPNDHRDVYDFVRPGSGELARISLGDARQLADATFHAGTGDGVVSEWVDEANRLHFYVLGVARDEEGVRRYRVGVRSLDGAGPFTRGLTLARAADGTAAPGRVAEAGFRLTNTGTGTDLVRLTATTDTGWETRLAHTVVEVPGGQTVDVPVHVGIPEDVAGSATLTLTATSETGGGTQTATATIRTS